MACPDDLHELSLETTAAINAAAVAQIDGNSVKEQKAVSKLEALLETLLQSKGSGGDGAKGASPAGATKQAMIDSILAKLGPLLSGYISDNPKKGASELKDLLPILQEYAQQNPTKGAALYGEVQGIMQKVSLDTSPQNYGVFANEFFEMGDLALKKRELNSALSGLGDLLSGPQSKDAEDAINKLGEDLSGRINPDAYKQLMQDLHDQLEQFKNEDAGNLQDFVNHLMSLLDNLTVANSDQAQTIFDQLTKGGNLATLFHLPQAERDNFLDALTDATQALGKNGNADVNALLNKIFGTLSDSTIAGLKSSGQYNNLENGVQNSLNSFKSKAGGSESDDYAQAMGMVALALQQLMVNVAKAQSDQDKINTIISQAQLRSAQAHLKSVDAKIKKVEEEREKAKHMSFWMKLIGAIVAALAVAIAALTCGLGAAIVVGVMTVVTMAAGPAITKAIAKSIENAKLADYTAQFEKEGNSPEKAKSMAKAKCEAEGGIIAAVIMIVISTVLTLGVGGLTSGASEVAMEGAEVGSEVADEAVSTSVNEIEMVPMGASIARQAATEAVEEVAEEVAEQTVENASSSASSGASNGGSSESGNAANSSRSSVYKATNGKLGWSSKGMGAMMVANTANTIAGSGLTSDIILATNTEWAYKHQKEFAAIVAVISIIIAAIGMIGGAKMMGARGGAMQMTSQMGRWVMRSAYACFAGGLTSAALGAVQADQQLQQADTYKEMGALEKEMMLNLFLTNLTSAFEKKVDADAQTQQKAIQSSMDMVEDSMDVQQRAASDVLAYSI